MQIKARITIQFTVLVTLLFAVSFAIIYVSSANYRYHGFFQRLQNKAATTVDLYSRVDVVDSTMLIFLDHFQKDKLPSEKVMILNRAGDVLYNSNDTIPLTITKAMTDQILTEGKADFVLDDQRQVSGISHDQGKYIVLATAYDFFGFKKLNNLKNTLITLFLLIVSVLAFAGWVFAGRALQPLSDLLSDIESVDVGKLNARLRPSRNQDEIGRLITAFNTLLANIEDAFQLQKVFVSGAAHELKNPLTAITSQLQVILLKERTNSEYRNSIKSILEDIQNLNRTTFDLMEYARLRYEDEISLDSVRIDDVIWQCTEDILKTHSDYEVHVDFGELPEDAARLEIRGNAALLKIALSNIIDNACKFSDDKCCRINMHVTDSQITLSFNDRGIGLTKNQIHYIFEPFYRANSTSEVKGHGIGLALTKKIMQLHQANILVDSELNKGTTFTVEIPVALAA